MNAVLDRLPAKLYYVSNFIQIGNVCKVLTEYLFRSSNCKLHPRNEQSNTKKLLDAFRQEIGNSDVEEVISDMHSMRAEKFLQYQKGRKIV